MKIHSAIELSLYKEIDQLRLANKDLLADNKDLRKHLHNIVTAIKDTDTDAIEAARVFLRSRT